MTTKPPSGDPARSPWRDGAPGQFPRLDETEAPSGPESAEPPSDAGAVPASAPEVAFAARVPPEAVRPLPSSRRAIFFDVENTSRAGDVTRVLGHLEVAHHRAQTDLVAVGNWRVIGAETARLLAQAGAQLIHSAPAVRVRDWSDLRIAVSAGVWLASASAGDLLEIVSDDQAFDAVADVAASLGVGFRRLSYRSLAGLPAGAPPPRGKRGSRPPAPATHARTATAGAESSAPAGTAGSATSEPETASHQEILAVVRKLAAASPDGVSLDAISNALKAQGFQRPAGSPRLITRLRRFRELEVAGRGMVRLASTEIAGQSPALAAEPPPPAPANGPRRRRRRRRGRRTTPRNGEAS